MANLCGSTRLFSMNGTIVNIHIIFMYMKKKRREKKRALWDVEMINNGLVRTISSMFWYSLLLYYYILCVIVGVVSSFRFSKEIRREERNKKITQWSSYHHTYHWAISSCAPYYDDKQINLFLLHKYLVIGTLNEIV